MGCCFRNVRHPGSFYPRLPVFEDHPRRFVPVSAQSSERTKHPVLQRITSPTSENHMNPQWNWESPEKSVCFPFLEYGKSNFNSPVKQDIPVLSFNVCFPTSFTNKRLVGDICQEHLPGSLLGTIVTRSRVPKQPPPFNDDRVVIGMKKLQILSLICGFGFIQSHWKIYIFKLYGKDWRRRVKKIQRRISICNLK